MKINKPSKIIVITDKGKFSSDNYNLEYILNLRSKNYEVQLYGMDNQGNDTIVTIFLFNTYYDYENCIKKFHPIKYPVYLKRLKKMYSEFNIDKQ